MQETYDEGKKKFKIFSLYTINNLSAALENIHGWIFSSLKIIAKHYFSMPQPDRALYVL